MFYCLRANGFSPEPCAGPPPRRILCLQLNAVEQQDSRRVLIMAAASSSAAYCPACHHASHSLYSRYSRVLSDLPWQGATVELRLDVQRFRCWAKDCPSSHSQTRLPLRRPIRNNPRIFSAQLRAGPSGRRQTDPKTDALLRAYADVPGAFTITFGQQCRWRRKRVPKWRRSGPLPGEPFGVSLSLFSEVLSGTARSRQGRAVVGRGEANP